MSLRSYAFCITISLFLILLLCNSVFCFYRTAHSYESTNCDESTKSAIKAIYVPSTAECVIRSCTTLGNRSYRVTCESELPTHPSEWNHLTIHSNTNCGGYVADITASRTSGTCAFWWFEGTNAIAAVRNLCLNNGLMIQQPKYAFDATCTNADHVIESMNTNQCVISSDIYHPGQSFTSNCPSNSTAPPIPPSPPTPPTEQPNCGTGCSALQCESCRIMQLRCCSGACYAENNYDCSDGLLCPKGLKNCNGACYPPLQYHCVNGNLAQGPEQNITNPPIPPIPVSSSVMPPSPPVPVSSSVIPPSPPINCPACSSQGLSCCNGQCYSESVYSCFENQILCPRTLKLCGNACYDDNVYRCVGGSLQPN